MLLLAPLFHAAARRRADVSKGAAAHECVRLYATRVGGSDGRAGAVRSDGRAGAVRSDGRAGAVRSDGRAGAVSVAIIMCFPRRGGGGWGRMRALLQMMSQDVDESVGWSDLQTNPF